MPTPELHLCADVKFYGPTSGHMICSCGWDGPIEEFTAHRAERFKSEGKVNRHQMAMDAFREDSRKNVV